ncbi:hypothetical protein BLNAU_21094 [Blattamonas nauphoetae]|uniref:Uncharacterized protein n=1 Tax=Blattamonas nauphoetae TaxID=2049346 RepID=A0ABQ9X131_9EUKA|nr:hypothetical protein BLNAU_21094 [Blattamonas nauphoetae]
MSADTHPPNPTLNALSLEEETNLVMKQIMEQFKTDPEAFEQNVRILVAQNIQTQREEEENKQEELKEVNKNIIKAQSETINFIKPILQHFPPPKFEGLTELISKFLLLNDGHILFSRTWLKNDTTVLSTPLLFRPVYIIILHEILKFIEDFFSKEAPKTRPGHAFYIAGDQGIGKTSLMLILMSTLSHRSLGFHYEKGFKDDSTRDFRPSKPNSRRTFSFDELLGPSRAAIETTYIHIHDDCPPPATIKDNHLHIIFTSPDPLRLPIPEPSPNHLCHIFRLPTFSLAEDAVTMVGCTPTVPFAVLSPEDMQLHTKDQQILLSIEMDKDEIAGRLPRASVDNFLWFKNSTVATELKNLVGHERFSLTQWKRFCSEVEGTIASREKRKEEEKKRKEEKANLNIVQGHPVTPHAADIPTGPVTQPADGIQSSNTELEKASPTGLKEAQLDSGSPARIEPESMEAAVDEDAMQKRKEDEEIDRFYTSLKEQIQKQSQKVKPEHKRIIAVVDWLMGQLKIPSERSKEQAEFIKGLFRKLVLFEWEQSERERENAQKAKAATKRKNAQKVGGSGEQKAGGMITREVKEGEEEEGNGIDTQDPAAARKDENAQKVGGKGEQNAERIITREVTEGEREEGNDIDTKDPAAASKDENDQKVGGKGEQNAERIITRENKTSPKVNGKGTVIEIPKTEDKNTALKTEMEEREKQMTKALFASASSYSPPSPNVIGEIQDFSELIKKVILTDQQTSPSTKDLTDLTIRLVNLKKLLEGSDVSEVVNRQNVQDKVTSVSKQDGLDANKRRTLLFSTLIDMLISPAPYDSKKKVLQSLFVHPKEDVNTSDISIRHHLNFLLEKSRSKKSVKKALKFIVSELIKYLHNSQMEANPEISARSKFALDKTKMANLACDFLMTIVNPPHIQEDQPHFHIKTRLDNVLNQIERVRVELSFVSLMDEFYFIAQDMNILVTPHSILRGLSERQEKPELDLIRERVVVYYGNVRDDGLRGWIENAIKTLLPLINTVGPLEAVSSKIKDNLNQVITQFNNNHPPSNSSDDPSNDSALPENEEEFEPVISLQFNNNPPPSQSSDDPSNDSPLPDKEEEVKPVINRQWLAIVRSVMNTILYLIDAGATRSKILEQYSGLRQLLTTVYMSNKHHLLRVAHQLLDLNSQEPESDYVNDLAVISKHFSTPKPLSSLEFLRTLQLSLESQDRLERMSIALFARNLLCFLQLETGFPFDEECYLTEFYIQFLQKLNPGDIVHRSFVDFMNATNLLSQKNFGLTPDNFTDFLEEEHPTLKTDPTPLLELRKISPLDSKKTDEIEPEVTDPDQPFKNFLTRQLGVHLLLWASTDLLLKAADVIPSQKPRTETTQHSQDEARPSQESGDEKTGNPLNKASPSQKPRTETTQHSQDEARPSQESGDEKTGNPLNEARPSQKPRTETTQNSQVEARPSEESEDLKTVHCLNVARASIFGPSPRWLTSTDARTNRGLVFLWDGVLDSNSTSALIEVAKSNHSRIMEFSTPLIYFEKTLNAAWDDISSLVPLLRDYKTKKKRPSLLRSVFSLIFKKTAEAIEQMERQILFVAVSPFVEQIMQSEVVAALAKLMTQAKYDEFKDHQAISGFKLPPYVEEPLVCISFLLNCPTPISFYETTTSFSTRHNCVPKPSLFWSRRPEMETTAKEVTKMPMLTFPKLLNKSVEGTKFPKSLSETDRGETDFYAEDLQEVTGGNLPGLDSLIVSRGTDKKCETIFMAIQATRAKSHSLAENGIILIQQLLFQAMCHLEPSERIVTIYNYATTQEEFIFPSRTGILGFHMVSSYMKFDENTLKHMSSLLRHRDHPLVTKPKESQTTMTTHDITDTLLANLPQYPTFSDELNPWETHLSAVNYPNEPNFILPYRWKLFSDVLRKSSPALFEQDGTVLRTIQELLRLGVTPDDLGESVEDRITTFKSFILCRAISCRRKELLHPNTGKDEVSFVTLVTSIVGTPDIQSIKRILTSLTEQASTMDQSIRDAHLQHLDDLCRENCIQTRLYPVYHVMTNNAMKRIRNPVQECLSVIQSEEDGGVFRVPTRNNLSAILHCGTVLLDHIFPIPPHPVTPHPTTDNSSTPTPHSQNVTPSLPQSKTLNIPLHSFVLATHGFSTSIPSLRDPTQDAVRKEVTNVTPSPLIRWLPHRVVIDPSLFPSDIQQADSLSYFTTFIHRLFDNPFIPVSTSLPTAILDRQHYNDVILTQLDKIITTLKAFKEKKDAKLNNELNQQGKKKDAKLNNELNQQGLKKDDAIQNKPDASKVKEAADKPEGPEIDKDGESQKTHIKPSIGKDKGLEDEVNRLSKIYAEKRVSSVISLLPEIRQYYQKFGLEDAEKSVVQTAINEIESMEANRQKTPTLVFVKSGSDFLAQSTENPEFVVDTKTEAHPFPFPFSTGYKEGELRKEMKQIYEALSDFLPKHFPKDHVSPSPPQDGPNKGQKDHSLSKTETDNRIGHSMDSAIRSLGETSTTPLFVFVVDEDLADHKSLPMSLHSTDGNVDCGVMRQRSIADVLWILFLTRISREVMALPLNTSMKRNDFAKYVFPFLKKVLRDATLLKGEDEKNPRDATLLKEEDEKIHSELYKVLISHVNSEGLDELNKHPSIGIELLVSAYPHVKDETDILSLSRLLMMCKSQPDGETRLNDLINDASPTNELELLTRWFALLSSDMITPNFVVPEEGGGFTNANIRSNLLTAFYLIIELKRDDQQPLVEKLLTTIRDVLDPEKPQFFTEDDKQTLRDFRAKARSLVTANRNQKPPNSTRDRTLNVLLVLIDDNLGNSEPTSPRNGL